MDEDKMSTKEALTEQQAKALLYDEKTLRNEEEQRPWSCSASSKTDPHSHQESILERLGDSVLMRCYDRSSGSQPDPETHRMLARAPRKRLDTYDLRQKSLQHHADYKSREPSPYISFTSHFSTLHEIAEHRFVARGGGGSIISQEQMVVFVDPRIRLARGLSILRYIDEMRAYDVKSPCDYDFWATHYLCLWEISPEEVMAIVPWRELRSLFIGVPSLWPGGIESSGWSKEGIDEQAARQYGRTLASSAPNCLDYRGALKLLPSVRHLRGNATEARHASVQCWPGIEIADGGVL